MTHGRMIEYDELQMFFGDEYVLNKYITIHQPTIKEIADYGENDYYSMVYTLCGIPSDSKSFLADLGIDYEQIEDFQYFIMLCSLFPQEKTEILFGDLDFQQFKVLPVEGTADVQLVNPITGCVIDKIIYQQMIDFVRSMHDIVPKVERAMDKQTKQFLIDEDRMNRRAAANKKQKKTSFLRPLVSSMLNSPGFKYNKNELKEVGIVEFMDSVQRIQIITQTKALMQGMYSGMMDTSKIKEKDLNWLRALEPKKTKGLGFKLA